jgi:sugar/nucleoside kinase (ribokinase family)
VDPETGVVSPARWRDPEADLAGVHAVFLSEADVGGSSEQARELLSHVPLVLLTRGPGGVELLTRDGDHSVPTRPVEEVDPTGAGDVFAAGFLIAYAETRDPVQAAAFACCAAACVVEAPGTESLGDRSEVERRLVLREQWLRDHGRESRARRPS